MTFDRNSLKLLVVTVVAELTNLDLSEVPEQADLFDLGIDSLEFTTIVVEVEERLDEDLSAEVFDAFDQIEVFTFSAVLDALMAGGPSPS